jgi:hypothetical protein
MDCKATNQDGTACRAAAGEDGYCCFHSPARADARADARRRGGLARAAVLARKTLADDGKPLDLPNAEAVRRLLADTIKNLLTGKLDCRVAATVGALAGTVLKALDVENLVHELEDAAGVDLDYIRAALKASSNPCPDSKGPS